MSSAQSAEGAGKGIRESAIIEGIVFSGAQPRLVAVRAEMAQFLDELLIGDELVMLGGSPEEGHLVYTLATPRHDTTTVDFHCRPEFALYDEILPLPDAKDIERQVPVVSRKEILLALMQHGRLTSFAGESCSVAAMRDHLGVRQLIAAWAEHTHWRWPGDLPPDVPRWCPKIWEDGMPRSGLSTREAICDVFVRNDNYSPYCYPATRLVLAQGLLDYYHRFKHDSQTVRFIEERVLHNQELLPYINPVLDVDTARIVGTPIPITDATRVITHGKLAAAIFEIPPDNFVPGDWAYFLNRDVKSAERRGYEGSNCIYLGRDRFNDYYFEHGGAYSKREKLDEIYLWRFEDPEGKAEKPKVNVSEGLRASLNRTPGAGGIVEGYRFVPYLFDGNPLPTLPAPDSPEL